MVDYIHTLDDFQAYLVKCHMVSLIMDPWHQALAGRGWKGGNHTLWLSWEHVTHLLNCSGVHCSFAC